MYSFDVFDTLITRRTAVPTGIFALMQSRIRYERDENGLDDYIVDNFYYLRIHSEELTRKSGVFRKKEEVSLRDIYTAMSVSGCLNDIQVD